MAASTKVRALVGVLPEGTPLWKKADQRRSRPDADHFRGPQSMYEARGFQPIEVPGRYTVMRRPVG